MKKIKYILFIFYSFALISCSENSTEQTKSETDKPEILPASDTSKQVVVPIPNTNTSSTGTNVKLNPQHGQPGHRCDIAVGAPLTGIGSSNLNIANSNSPDIKLPVQTNPVNQNKQTPLSGTNLNPAHGLPGHRCDIEVGQPLNSIPKQ